MRIVRYGFLASSWLTLLALTAGAPRLRAEVEPVHVRVSVAVGQGSALLAPRTDFRVSVQEADAIWRPYGVSVTLTESDEAGPGLFDVRIGVHVVERIDLPARGAEIGSLGAVTFLGDEGPEPVITLAVGTLREVLAGGRLGGRLLQEWPTIAVDRVRARALGRVLAHELGHYVLWWRAHRAEGLMRAAFGPRELIDPSRNGFRLESVDLPRLQTRLGRLAPATAPSLAGSPRGQADKP